MRRTWLLLSLLLPFGSLRAQGIFAGMLMDPKLETPLPCDEALRYLRNAQFEPARRAGTSHRPVCALLTGWHLTFGI